MSLKTLIETTVLPERQYPTAVAKADPAFGIIGSVIKLDGRLSTDPDNNDLTYEWAFDSVPIGSRVIGEGFRIIDEDGALVSFSPDIVGEYVIGLTVSNGMFESVKSQTASSIRATLVPHGRGLVPDGKWLWSYIRDVWQQVDNKEMFEVLWSSLIQIVGADLLKLYEIDFNKSIRDIQDLFQRRWLSYEPSTAVLVNGPDFFIGSHYAGTNASTINLGLNGSAIILSATEVIIIEGSVLQNVSGETVELLSSRDASNLGAYTLVGTNSPKNGYKIAVADQIPAPTADLMTAAVEFIFTSQSRNWELYGANGASFAELMAESGSPLDYLLDTFAGGNPGLNGVQVGDVIHYRTGANKGFYRITAISGAFIEVDKSPASFSDSTTITTHKANIYRPVRFAVTQPDLLLTDTIAIPYDEEQDASVLAPGRVIVLNGQTFTIVRASLDRNQRVPMVIITIDSLSMQSGLEGLSWRTPPTLVSTTQDFEADGAFPGDILIFDLIQNGSKVVEIPCQVVGVRGGRIGFVFTTDELESGVAPEVMTSTILSVASAFGVEGVTEEDDGSLSYSSTAAEYLQTINSGEFASTYWNIQLTPETNISINPNFTARARLLIRNHLIPVDEDLVSIPLLQNFIVQPVTQTRLGKTYQLHEGKEYELKSAPILLKENIDYIVDGQTAFDGRLVFKTGSDVIDADDIDFLDRGIRAGDKFIINDPITLARTYYIKAVISSSRLQLTEPVPEYSLSTPSFPLSTFVTADVEIERSREGHFIRLTPGRFTAASPAPDRLWAEVSFFNNDQNIEDNFGILVGVTREDIDSVSADLNYRQAVAGTMFAFLKGSAIERVRLGAQILLGLPFAENRGIIRSIEDDYRFDILGNPILGRILIEDVDNVGQPQSTLRVYTYPIELVSDLGGLEVNPETDEVYKVGDVVEKFATLSKGVEVSDYVSSPLELDNFSIERILQQYHSIRIRINDDIFGLNEIGLVSRFLKKITPSYVSFFISSLSEFADDVSVLDFLSAGVTFGAQALVDNASLSISPTLMLNSRNASGIPQISLDNGVSWIRRTGFDLQSTIGSSTVTIPAGGLLNARASEDFESPLTRIGDKLTIFGGLNAGTYTISAVTDTTATISDGPTLGLQTSTASRYAVSRVYKTVLVSDVGAQFTASDPVVVLNGGLRSDGASPGDWLLNLNATTMTSVYPRHTITEVQESVLGSGIWDRVSVTPVPDQTGVADYMIVRPTMIESPYPSDGSFFSITSDGTNTLTAASDVLRALVEAGDDLQIQNAALDRLLMLAPTQLYVVPAPPIGIYNVVLIKKNRPALGTGFGHIHFFDPLDVADITLTETQSLASCSATSDLVTLQSERTTAPAAPATNVNPITLNMRPMDYLVISGGVNGAIDVGYGIGVYPIVAVTSTELRLAVDLTATETRPWSVIRRR